GIPPEDEGPSSGQSESTSKCEGQADSIPPPSFQIQPQIMFFNNAQPTLPYGIAPHSITKDLPPILNAPPVMQLPQDSHVLPNYSEKEDLISQSTSVVSNSANSIYCIEEKFIMSGHVKVKSAAEIRDLKRSQTTIVSSVVGLPVIDFVVFSSATDFVTNKVYFDIGCQKEEQLLLDCLEKSIVSSFVGLPVIDFVVFSSATDSVTNKVTLTSDVKRKKNCYWIVWKNVPITGKNFVQLTTGVKGFGYAAS
uniref:Protein kinase domain-containing protein n=1 Tax=Rhabditophanes sp. KR3021 TaxID=114890 RepID=A0AC35U1W6_9BILA